MKGSINYEAEIDLKKNKNAVTSKNELYPVFRVSNIDDTFVPLLDLLLSGEFSLVVEIGGKRKLLKKIDLSAYNVHNLLKYSTLDIEVELGSYIRIDSASQYILEVLDGLII